LEFVCAACGTSRLFAARVKGKDGNRPGRERIVRQGGDRVIRQAISCDICGTEKKQTNHWFVTYDQGEELRVSGWNSLNSLLPGSKHLCGQTCLHGLVDDFLARTLASRIPRSAQNDEEDEMVGPGVKTDTNLTSVAASGEVETTARLISPSALVSPARPPLRMPMELVALPVITRAEEAAVAVNEPPRSASRNGVPRRGNGSANYARLSGTRARPPASAKARSK
jgi:hypothetical protein